MKPRDEVGRTRVRLPSGRKVVRSIRRRRAYVRGDDVRVEHFIVHRGRRYPVEQVRRRSEVTGREVREWRVVL